MGLRAAGAATLAVMDQATGRRRRRIGRIAAAVMGGALLVATTLPLVVRGPVARWAVFSPPATFVGDATS